MDLQHHKNDKNCFAKENNEGKCSGMRSRMGEMKDNYQHTKERFYTSEINHCP